MSKQYPGGFLTKNYTPPALTGAPGVWTLDQAMQAQKSGTWPYWQLYSDDVFSAFTYTGNGATRSITTGIDMTKGGLVWTKCRQSARIHQLVDTVRGATNALDSASTAGNAADGSGLTAFSSTGYTLGVSTVYNINNETYASWTFRKAARFFDVVTYTGNGASNRLINHSLGITPGMVICKRTDSAEDWAVWTKGPYLGFEGVSGFSLNSTVAAGNTSLTAGFDASTFRADHVIATGNIPANTNGATYVAYLFAHDTTTDGLIQCGSFTTTGSTAGSVTGLPWEPQFLILRRTSGPGNWFMLDTARGWSMSDDSILEAQSSAAEGAAAFGNPTATGFDYQNLQASSTYIYLAIRRPNKPPTSGTSVYFGIASDGAGSAKYVGFAPDLRVMARKDATGSNYPMWTSRLQGENYLVSSGTAAEASSGGTYFNWGYDTNYAVQGLLGGPPVSWLFRRAPGVMDVVCFTGDGTGSQRNHSLGVPPELLIQKARGTAGINWGVTFPLINSTGTMSLNLTDASSSVVDWSGTATTFKPRFDVTSTTYVVYLFATKAGISKVFSYTGNGSSQTINCGFTTGARFVLIRRTDSTGDWYVWDSVRGIVAGNDPHLSLNTTAAEVTTDDSVDTDATGFIVNQLAATNINVNTATYIGLAFA